MSEREKPGEGGSFHGPEDPDGRHEKAREEAAERGETAREDLPSAGPHAEEHLTDHGKTPGTGALPDTGSNDEIDPGAG